MTAEEFARICFAARPVMWAIAIIAIILVATTLMPKLWNPIPPSNSGSMLSAH